MAGMLAHGPYAEFAVLLIISALAGAIAVRLRQPVLIAYIVVGILVGPAVFGIVTAHDQVALLAEIGVTVLLFVVGLKLDLHHIRHIGPVALATGLGQLGFTIVFGFLIIVLMGKSLMEALYVAVALTFSSTIIVVKLLSDKRELDSLHGRIAVGFLIVQDVAVVLAMMTMSALRGAGEDAVLAVAGQLALRLVGATALMFVLMRYVLPWLVARHGALAGAAADLRHRLGHRARRARRGRRLQQGGGRLHGRLLARLDRLPRGDERAPDRHPRLHAAVLLRGPRRQARLLHPRRRAVAGGDPVALRADRQPADRDGDHGLHGLPQAHRLHGRPHRGADQRVLHRVRGDGHHPRPRRCRSARAHHAGRAGHHHDVHLHDPVLAAALRAPRAACSACSSASGPSASSRSSARAGRRASPTSWCSASAATARA